MILGGAPSCQYVLYDISSGAKLSVKPAECSARFSQISKNNKWVLAEANNYVLLVQSYDLMPQWQISVVGLTSSAKHMIVSATDKIDKILVAFKKKIILIGISQN